MFNFFSSQTGSPIVDAELRDSAIEPPLSPKRRMLISQILGRTQHGTFEFLEQFDDAELEQYLSHLEVAEMPRGRASFWVRPTNAPAFVGRAVA